MQPKMKAKLQAVVDDLVSTVAEKNRKYGDSHSKVDDILSILFPDGVPRESRKDLIKLVRILDKVCRISSGQLDDTEDPWQDIAGYALLRLVEGRC